MKFARVTKPGKPASSVSVQIAMIDAALLSVMAVGQLFAFTKFQLLVEQFQLPIGQTASVLLASIIPVCEVFTLPFLLRMYVSPLMRIVSMGCGWLVALAWLYVTLIVSGTLNTPNIGFLGSEIHLPAGWWTVSFACALAILSGWASWGLWPFSTAKK